MGASLSKFATLFKTRIKTKKIHRVLEFNQFQWLKSKQHTKNNTQKIIDEKSLYTLMDNAAYFKAMENLKNKIDVRLLRKRLFETDIKTKVYITKKT